MKYCLDNIIAADESCCIKIWLSHLQLPPDTYIGTCSSWWLMYMKGEMMVIDIHFDDIEENYSTLLIEIYFYIKLKFNPIDFQKMFFIQDFNETINNKMATYWFYQQADIFPMLCPSKCNIANIIKEEVQELVNRTPHINNQVPTLHDVHRIIHSIHKKYSYDNLIRLFQMHIAEIKKSYNL